MKTNPDFLHVKGSEIANRRGDIVRLRGFCLGGWMNMENFITGYPGHESGMRAALARVLGEDKTRFFLERFLHYFFTKDDLRFIKSLGCNVLRISLNYRHFEGDDRPFEYRSEGFALLDQVIGWAHDHQVYVILDLHAVPGWQSSGWHCDNPGGQPQFWGQRVFEDRTVALWQELARRYRDEPFVAGYNVMNEPEAKDVKWLNRYYHRVTDAIRAIDSDHILFLEGNHYSQQFQELDPPFDANTVYSSHNYVVPALDNGQYPGTFHGEHYGREQLEESYRKRTAWIREQGVPHWFGEFGCIYTDTELESSRLRVMADMIEVAEEHGDHWTIWTYKDIGKMGLVFTDPESEWMRRTKPIREIKTALRCDSWIERHETRITSLIQQIAEHASTVTADQSGDWWVLDEALRFAICDGVLSQRLLPAFAEQFRGMDEGEIDRMMESFALRNCTQREGLVQVVTRATARP
jgi:aryl-phospho-beta-D-glucosidase BglC (GH1 family)